MPGLTAIIRANGENTDGQAAVRALDPLDNCVTRIWQTGSEFLVTSYLPEAPSIQHRFYEDGDCIGLFAGDIVNAERLNWLGISQELPDVSGLRAILPALKGAFAIVVYDLKKNVLWMATDLFGFQPLYFFIHESEIVLSTSIGSFLRLPFVQSGRSDEWIHQYLFFNYPVAETSLIENVHRVPAATLGKFESNTGRLSWSRYAENVSCRRMTVTGQAAIENAIMIFGAVVPEWFQTDRRSIFGLSGGLDCRAALAALPSSALSDIESFTYGIPGSTELIEARSIAAALGMRHNEVLLDDKFLSELPALIDDTVFLSDGQQVINRSNLTYVYAALADASRPYSTIVTGVTGDHLFRDHISAWGNVPYLISAAMAAMFRNGRKRISREFYAGMLGSRFAGFEEQIESLLDSLEQTYGEFTDPEAYFRYLIYVAGPRYFGGQAAIANTFSTFRTPYWDRRLIHLAMDVDLSTIGFSKRHAKKYVYQEAELQASVIANNPRFLDIPYINLPLDIYSAGNSVAYQFHRLSRKIKSVFYTKRGVVEEDWSLWYRTTLSDDVDRLLGNESIIKEYVSDTFIKKQIAETNIHWLGKLMTLEIALRLMDNGWKKR